MGKSDLPVYDVGVKYSGEPGPRDDTVKDAARELTERIFALNGMANAYLRDPNHGPYRLGLENALAAVEELR